MSLLNVKGIAWKARSENYRTSFHHQNVSILTRKTWNDQEVSQVIVDKVPLFSHPSRAECIKVGSVLLLDAYATRLVPLWEENDA